MTNLSAMEILIGLRMEKERKHAKWRSGRRSMYPSDEIIEARMLREIDALDTAISVLKIDTSGWIPIPRHLPDYE